MGIHGDQSATPYEVCSNLRTLSVPVAGGDTHLGFVFSECTHRLRACLSALQPRTPISIQCRSVFTVEQGNLAPTATLDASKWSDPIDFVFAPDYRSDVVDFRRPLTSSSSSATAGGGGRPTEISGDAVFLAASSVVVGRDSSRRGFFVAGLSSSCGGCGDASSSSLASRSQGRVRFAALRRAATVRFRFA
jgi:hypothetical protein